MLPAGPKRAAPPNVLQDREAKERRRPAKKIVEHIHLDEEVERSHRSRMTPAKLLAHLDKQCAPHKPPSPAWRYSSLDIIALIQLHDHQEHEE